MVSWRREQPVIVNAVYFCKLGWLHLILCMSQPVWGFKLEWKNPRSTACLGISLVPIWLCSPSGPKNIFLMHIFICNETVLSHGPCIFIAFRQRTSAGTKWISPFFFFFANECVKEMNINGFLLILRTGEQSSLCCDFFLYVFSFVKYS